MGSRMNVIANRPVLAGDIFEHLGNYWFCIINHKNKVQYVLLKKGDMYLPTKIGEVLGSSAYMANTFDIVCTDASLNTALVLFGDKGCDNENR